MEMNTNSGGVMKLAEAADLVLTNHRDASFLEQTIGATVDAVETVMGARFSAEHAGLTQIAATLLFNSANLLANTQTLGEEYCSLAAVSATTATLPTFGERLVLALFYAVIPQVVANSPQLAAWFAAEYPSAHTAKVRDKLRDWSPTLRQLANIGSQCHLVLFYLRGMYYHASYRAAQIRHVVVNPNPGPPPPSYRPLGFMLGMQLALTTVSTVLQRYRAYAAAKETAVALASVADTQQENGDGGGSVGSGGSGSTGGVGHNDADDDSEDDAEVDPAKMCVLCLNNRKDTTATPCGHLLCWTCAVEWCNTKPECPVCRQASPPKKLVRLYNFD